MAKSNVVSLDLLDEGLILTPERYDSLKTVLSSNGTPIENICYVSKSTLSTKKADPNRMYLVLDTGDVRNGFIRYKDAVCHEEIGSTKKVLEAGDVIISRLRPYLRQVGFVDQGLINSLPKGTKIVCSTEFFILRSDSDISFLAPILLSDKPQQILNVSQEGGHHPRFNQQTLESICIEQQLLDAKDNISERFRFAIDNIRSGEQETLTILKQIEKATTEPIL